MLTKILEQEKELELNKNTKFEFLIDEEFLRGNLKS